MMELSNKEIEEVEVAINKFEQRQQWALDFVMRSPMVVLNILMVLKELVEFMLVFYKEKELGSLRKFGWKVFWNKNTRKEFGDILKAIFTTFLSPSGLQSYVPDFSDSISISHFVVIDAGMYYGNKVEFKEGKYRDEDGNTYLIDDLMDEFRFSPVLKKEKVMVQSALKRNSKI